MYQEIDSYELFDIMKRKDINLIDIRDEYIYSSGTIGNAKNIPQNYLITNPNDYFDALSDVISEDYLNNNGNLSEQYHNDFDQQWSRMEEAYTNAGWTKGADGKWSKSNASNNNNNTQNNTNNNQNS